MNDKQARITEIDNMVEYLRAAANAALEARDKAQEAASAIKAQMSALMDQKIAILEGEPNP